MKILHVNEWAIEDFTEQEAQDLKLLGWQWVDANINGGMLYGHFRTYDKTLAEATAKILKNATISELRPNFSSPIGEKKLAESKK